MAVVNKKAPKMKQKKNRLCTKATVNAMQWQFQTRGRGGMRSTKILFWTPQEDQTRFVCAPKVFTIMLEYMKYDKKICGAYKSHKSQIILKGRITQLIAYFFRSLIMTFGDIFLLFNSSSS